MTGKQIVAEAAKRAAEQCDRALGLSGTQAEHSIALIVAQDHFAPFAELIEAARSIYRDCRCNLDDEHRAFQELHALGCQWLRVGRLHAALAVVEKIRGEK